MRSSHSLPRIMGLRLGGSCCCLRGFRHPGVVKQTEPMVMCSSCTRGGDVSIQLLRHALFIRYSVCSCVDARTMLKNMRSVMPFRRRMRPLCERPWWWCSSLEWKKTPQVPHWNQASISPMQKDNRVICWSILVVMFLPVHSVYPFPTFLSYVHAWVCVLYMRASWFQTPKNVKKPIYLIVDAGQGRNRSLSPAF